MQFGASWADSCSLVHLGEDWYRLVLFGEQGCCSGESTRLPPMWPGFNSRRQRHMWVEFVFGSLPCSERFFSGYSGFPLFSKTNISKLQFDQESGRRRTIMWMCYLQIVIHYLFNLFTYLVQLSADWSKLVQTGAVCCMMV